MQNTITINAWGEQITLVIGSYAKPNNPSIQAFCEDGSPFAVLSTNPMFKLNDGLVAIKEWGGMEDLDVVSVLAENGIIEPQPSGDYQSGYVTVKVYPFIRQ